jgi:hypothetical protein
MLLTMTYPSSGHCTVVVWLWGQPAGNTAAVSALPWKCDQLSCYGSL